MQSRLLPLFPLQLVVFPRVKVRLHIYEERYKDMMGEVISSSSEFGIVLAKENGIVNAGCTATVEKVLKKYPDGRMDIEAGGRRRFEVFLLNEEKPYLRGEVDFFDDDEPGPAPLDLQRKALLQYQRLLDVGESSSTYEPILEDPQLSFQLAQRIGDLDFLNLLLRSRSEVQRLQQLTEFLVQYVPKQQVRARMRQLAPLNGHGVPPTSV